MEAVLNTEYGGITGFIGVSVTGFREGSIFTDFVVETTEVKTAEFAEANKAFSKAVNSTIAPVIGSVTALYNSDDKLRIGGIIYNGNRMRLVCEPRVNVGKISSVEWTFRGRVIDGDGRRKITNSGTTSVLTIEKADVVLDIGIYQCTLMGDVLQFRQERDVIGDDIQEAPIIVSKSHIPVRCLGTEAQTVPLECCVQSPFKVKWFKDSLALDAGVTGNGTSFCCTYEYTLEACGGPTSLTFTCKVDDLDYRRVTTLSISEEPFTCEDDEYGDGREGELSSKECPTYQVGGKMAKCVHGKWILVEDTCVIRVIKDLLVSSGGLHVDDVPDFVEKLSEEVKVIKNVTKEPNSISTIVEILGNIADVTLEVNKPVMKDVLQTVDDIIGEDSRESWTALNANENNNASSDLLRSMELLSDKIVGTFTFETDAILFNRSTFDNSFYANLNNSVVLDIPNTGFRNISITTITFFTLNIVMPVRSSSFNTSVFNTNNTDPVNVLNAAVVLIKAVMLAIGFLLGYGCPLIIAVVTVAATAPGDGYIMNKEACWLNWEQTRALLAFVIPALTIVCINIIIVIVVLFKMLRRGVGDASQREERHTLVVILRCVAILTPLFGLTWSLGVGTMLDSTNRGLHIVFALFNSLQGFFILVFGTLLDSKIRSILARTSPGSNTTRSTSGGISSTGLNWFHRLRGRRNVYRMSEAANSGSAGASESFSNI
ncbi:hypothetical protein CgunFtcFv8_009006 [Champsocephalus gunnari]|uniref:Uncharacterized protein n=1 Tax=Champsocephalus gunnari TaxID=52237 RepID=A0AAN8HJI0_CHAGU|nr:hypothetical protein CgunFtcFv8_009006 [Champsocephalus gunnari]